MKKKLLILAIIVFLTGCSERAKKPVDTGETQNDRDKIVVDSDYENENDSEILDQYNLDDKDSLDDENSDSDYDSDYDSDDEILPDSNSDSETIPLTDSDTAANSLFERWSDCSDANYMKLQKEICNQTDKESSIAVECNDSPNCQNYDLSKGDILWDAPPTGQSLCYFFETGWKSGECKFVDSIKNQDGHIKTNKKSVGKVKINNKFVYLDPVTKLMWQEGKSSEIKYSEFINPCENLDYAGFGDWRVPTLHELRSIADFGENKMAFWDDDGQNKKFFSSDKSMGFDYSATVTVDFSTLAESSGFVKCVRDEKPPKTAANGENRVKRFQETEENITTDVLTNLKWFVPEKLGNWIDAMDSCNKMAGWRVPDINELAGLIDYSVKAGDDTISTRFELLGKNTYWSSTTNSGNFAEAKVVDFINGNIINEKKDASKSIICVKSELVPDPVLNGCLKNILSLPASSKLEKSDIQNIAYISVYDGNKCISKDTKQKIRSIQGLEYADNLLILVFEGHKISDLTSLTELSSLKTAGLYSNPVENIAPLINNNIEDLQLNYTFVKYIPEIVSSSIKNIYLDQIDNCPEERKIRDISGLSGVSSLNTLHLNENAVSSGFESLSGKQFLQYLSVGRNGIDNNELSSICENVNESLLSIDLYGNSDIQNIQCLNKFIKLDYLSLNGLASIDISNLFMQAGVSFTFAESLKTIYLNDTDTDTSEAIASAVLKGLVLGSDINLVELHIANSGINSAQQLPSAKFQNLEILNASSNNIGVEFSSIYNFLEPSKLTYLDFSNNNITDISAITNSELQDLSAKNPGALYLSCNTELSLTTEDLEFFETINWNVSLDNGTCQSQVWQSTFYE